MLRAKLAFHIAILRASSQMQISAHAPRPSAVWARTQPLQPSELIVIDWEPAERAGWTDRQHGPADPTVERQVGERRGIAERHFMSPR